MKKILLVIGIVSLMASCSDREYSGNREVTQIARVRLDNGEIDWVRLNAVEMKVYKEGDTTRINRLTHRIQIDTIYRKAVITSIVK